MEVILDSSFILTAVKNKVDFVSSLLEKGFNIKVPREVLIELKDLRFKVSHSERSAIDIGLELISKNNIKKMTLGKQTVDEGLISKGKEGIYIATLDNAIKRVIPNKVSLSNSKKDIVIERE